MDLLNKKKCFLVVCVCVCARARVCVCVCKLTGLQCISTRLFFTCNSRGLVVVLGLLFFLLTEMSSLRTFCCCSTYMFVGYLLAAFLLHKQKCRMLKNAITVQCTNYSFSSNSCRQIMRMYPQLFESLNRTLKSLQNFLISAFLFHSTSFLFYIFLVHKVGYSLSKE